MKVFIVSCVLLSVAFAQTVPSNEQTILKECFEKDSIACVQNTVYRRAREFFDQPSIQIGAGVSFAKVNERAAKSLEEPLVEQAATVEARELALEDYLLNRVKNFFTERKVSFDVASAGRSISNAIPEEVKESVRELVVEGRTKRKLLKLKKLIPLLGLLKLKLAGLAVLTLAGIALLAKKALITSFVAIGIAGFTALSGLLAKLLSLGAIAKSSGGGGEDKGGFPGGPGGLGNLLQSLGGGGGGGKPNFNGPNVEEIIAYTSGGNGGGSGWSSGGNGWSSGWEEGAHSQPIGQAVAYKGHHHTASRR